MLISDWSSDVCSSDLKRFGDGSGAHHAAHGGRDDGQVALAVALHDVLGEHRRCEEVFGRDRSEERRVGKEWVSTCRCLWSQYHEKQSTTHISLCCDRFSLSCLFSKLSALCLRM